MSDPRTRERLHGFDAVRGLAAIAVVALHAAYPYALAPMEGLVWPVPLDEPSRFVDACFWCVEGFVMPLFFTISGYFLARSLARQSAWTVLTGRSRRLIVSFWTVGITILAIDLLIWTSGFVVTGQATWRDFRRMKFGPEIDAHLWGPAHLWYLEYLWVLCASACVAVAAWKTLVRQFGPILLFSPRWSAVVASGASPRWWPRLAAVSIAVFLVLWAHPEIVLGFQHHFIVPAWPKLLHGGLFLALGLALYRSGSAVEWLRRSAPIALAVAAAAFAFLLPRIVAAMSGLAVPTYDASFALLLSVYALSSVLGCLGAGFRWLDRPIPSLERLAAASFWIYVAHHPICGLLQIALRYVTAPPIVKFAAVASVTLGLCLVTYRGFVRNSPIERMLDGEWPWHAFRRPAVAAAPAPAPLRKAA